MTPASYTKDELLAILNEKCPDALAKFPPPEDFTIKVNVRGSVDSPTLRVGHVVIGKSRKIKGELWLEEYDSGLRNSHIPRQHPIDVNDYIKNSKGFKGLGIFSKFTDRGDVGMPFANPMRALFRFIMLLCGYSTVYEEFKDVNGKLQGLKPLVYGLKNIAKRFPAPQDLDLDAPEPAEEGEDDEGLFIQEGVSNKRTFQTDKVEDETRKKMRTE
ncbi:hypothetical protein FB567DRAFT_589567 [Paraphoma chrysanthemicola]|uniref:Uncharacterized protein n=1 Tax=Paraphoma chrysanthemicola TaxID=798071 RepID=A0A8K0RCL1_9PLEO|nr:hypothetical protein FB567DRAFT_589567 [Paraphoma chrysanthemicola]